MRRSPFLLVGLLVMTGYAGQGVQPREVSGVEHGTPQWYMTEAGLSSTEYSEVEAGLYRYDMHPVTPATGIPTGWVIAYGHLLARPYQFTVKQDTLLFVNGIQVEPALKNPAYWRAFDLEYARVESLGKLHPDTLWGALRGAFKSTFQRLIKAHVDSAAIAESLMALVKRSPGVRQEPVPLIYVRPGLSSASLQVSYVGRGFRFLHECYSEGHEPAPLSRETSEERRSIKVWAVHHDLTSDSLWLLQGQTCMYGYWAGGSYNGGLPDRICAVLSADSTDWQAKFASMQARLGPPKSVKEVMYNFDRHEYGQVLGQGQR